MRRSISKFAPALALALALVQGAPIAAQEPDEKDKSDTGSESDADSPALVEYVEVDASSLPASNTIATKLPVPVHETPANVGTVGSARIEEQRAIVLGDALADVSGINVVAGNGVHDYFVVRGFDSLSSGLIMTDGAAEPEVTLYPLYNVVGVEVLKGPAGFLYGPNPLAGAVNMVRKQPLPTDLGRVAVSGGSFGAKRATLDWNLANDGGDRAVRLNGLWQEADHYRNDKYGRHAAINPSFALKFGEGKSKSLTLNLEHVEAEYAPDSGLPLYSGDVPDVPRRRSYQSPFDFSEQEIDRFQADFEMPLTETVRLRNKTYYRGLDWLTNGTQFVGVGLLAPFGGSPSDVFRTLLALDDEQRLVGNQLEFVMDFGGGVEHSLLAGLEISRLDDDFKIDVAPPVEFNPPGVPGLPAINLFDPVETATSITPFPFHEGESSATILAPYVIDNIRLSERFRLVAGLRYDDIDTEVDFAFNGLGQPSFSRDDSKLSPMGGLVVACNPDLTLYANASKSYSPIGARVSGASQLEPESSRQIEVGVKKQFDEHRFQATLAAYRLDRENIAITDDGGITQQPGDQRSQGIELELAAEPLRGLRTLLSYAYNDAELTSFFPIDPFAPGPAVDRSGNRPPFAPEHLASLWVSHGFANGLGVGGGARYASDQYIAPDNAFQIDGAVVLAATVFYDVPKFRLSLNLENLTDKEYETRGFGSRSVTPADPFGAYAGIEYRF